MISKKTFVSENAKISDSSVIYPFVYIEDDVEIGDNCTIYPFTSIMAGTRLGNNNKVFQGSVLGAVPQDFDFTGEATRLVIGDNNTIRENVVINRATHTNDETVIGSNNFIMEGAHLSHDVKLGDNIVIGYGTKIGGCCEVQHGAILSSNVIANPGSRVGICSMVQSNVSFSKDVPPFIIAHHNPVEYGGVNSTLLTHAGIEERVQRHIANAYRLLFNGKVGTFDAINQIVEQVVISEEIEIILAFLRSTKLGIISKDR